MSFLYVNREYKLQIFTIKLLVACPNNPPNVTFGVKVARNKYINEATHWMCIASLKSLTYHGSFLLISAISPPHILK
jgi:hypothetical protein